MSEKKRSFDINAIKERIPHRYPFLMVDRIEDSGPKFAVGLKNISVNEPFFEGHFPDNPIMPGAMITEFILQTSAFIEFPSSERNPAEEALLEEKNESFFCVGFNMKFTGIAIPGDRLLAEVKLIRRLDSMIKVKAVVKNEKGIVASGDVSLAKV